MVLVTTIYDFERQHEKLLKFYTDNESKKGNANRKSTEEEREREEESIQYYRVALTSFYCRLFDFHYIQLQAL